MPYRVFLAQIGERLRGAFDGRASGYEHARQFRDDVALIAASLKANKGANAGLFYVKRLLRRIDTFGFHLATLDVRQHASVLHQVIAQGLADDQWLARSRRERRDLLAEALEQDRGPVAELDALGKRTLAVFEAIMQGRHRYGPEALGYFIISGAAGADDMLAALLLARWAAAYDKRTGEVALDIAPQFETEASLSGCAATLQELLADPLYRRHLEARGRRQCVLIGYSDSNKEGGTCASRFLIHQAQADIARVLTGAGEQHVLFHARGGSLARGGGRIEAILRAAPAGAVDGVLRIREQGSTVKQGYGLRPIAMRTLERAFNALSLTTAAGRAGRLAPDSPAHLQVAAAARAGERYRLPAPGICGAGVLRVLPGGHPDRRHRAHADRLALGASRRPTLSSARCLPVPWVFAWSQARYMLPGWYGAGSGLAAAARTLGLAGVREAYGSWFFLEISSMTSRPCSRGRTSRSRATTRRSLRQRWAASAAIFVPSMSSPASRFLRSRTARRCWIRTRRCSVPSDCATRTSIR